MQDFLHIYFCKDILQCRLLLYKFTLVMMTVSEYAKKRGISIQTVYSWIYRNQTEKNGFTFKQIGSVKLIEELKAKKKAA